MSDISSELELFRSLNLALCECYINLNHEESKSIMLDRCRVVFWHINNPIDQLRMNNHISDVLLAMLAQLASIYRSKKELIRTASSHQSMKSALQELIVAINLFKEQQHEFLNENQQIVSKLKDDDKAQKKRKHNDDDEDDDRAQKKRKHDSS